MIKNIFAAISILTLITTASADDELDSLKKKCDDGEFASCYKLADVYANGDEDVQDFAKADKYYDKACSFGHVQEACEALVFNKGAISRIKSYRVPKDVQRAAKIYNYAVKSTNYDTLYELFKQYCEDDKDLRACAYYGEMKVSGIGTRITVNRGIKLIKESCAEGDVYACSNLGYRYFAADEIDTDEFKAFKLLNYACSNGEFGSCRYVAAFYENNIGVKYDKDKIKYLYSKACDNADAISCHKLGSLYSQEKDQTEKAIEAFNTGCEFGSVRSCTSLGLIYYDGKKMQPDEKKAFNLFKSACDGNDSTGCYYLAECYANGKGVKKSRNVASTIFSKACDVGSSEACEYLEKHPGTGPVETSSAESK
ncbi:SEL1-like repeat protein [uncultured Succinivibrio sp.]|uniref:SEL1-like repeat protein n=1 Tax=uncultured Succinivibrio sp. TaxID=540749 RepID=UPI0025E11578|nr:SEL1-like repeat protein [uncultured Succinivibrio sp.]